MDESIPVRHPADGHDDRGGAEGGRPTGAVEIPHIVRRGGPDKTVILFDYEPVRSHVVSVGLQTANVFCASNKSGKRYGDIQSNNAKQAAADPTEDGTTIPSQPFESKPARDVVFR